MLDKLKKEFDEEFGNIEAWGGHYPKTEIKEWIVVKVDKAHLAGKEAYKLKVIEATKNELKKRMIHYGTLPDKEDEGYFDDNNDLIIPMKDILDIIDTL